MKLVVLSDTHNSAWEVNVPEGDILIFAGDFSFMGKANEIYDFIGWLKDQPHKHKLWIPGNHELGLEDFLYNIEVIDNETDATCIHNKEYEIEDIKFFGSAMTPTFMNWAFMYNKEQAKRYWENAPDKVDILITHGPPYGYLDTNKEGEMLGCKYLLKYIEKVQPKVHVWGHIHEAYGSHIKQWEDTGNITHMFNTSVMDRDYSVTNPPVVIDIDKNGNIK